MFLGRTRGSRSHRLSASASGRAHPQKGETVPEPGPTFTQKSEPVPTFTANAAHLKSQISDLKSLAESCSRQIRGWADSLENSDIRGQRHLNDATRKTYDQRHRMDAFLEKLEQVRAGADPASAFGEPDARQ